MLDFVIGVDSEFYPDADSPYRERIAQWAEQRPMECRLEEETDDADAATDGVLLGAQAVSRGGQALQTQLMAASTLTLPRSQATSGRSTSQSSSSP